MKCIIIGSFADSPCINSKLQGDGPVRNECKTALIELVHFIKANPVSISL